MRAIIKDDNIRRESSPDINTQPILEAINAGRVAMLVTGNFKDFANRENDTYHKPYLIYQDLQQAGYVVVITSLSSGVQIFQRSSLPKELLEDIDKQFKRFGIEQNKTPLNEEMVRLFRGAEIILTQKQKAKIAWVIDYVDHLAPNPQNSHVPDEKKVAIETIHKISNNPDLRHSENVLICVANNYSHCNPLLYDLEKVDYDLPDEHQTAQFARIIQSKVKNHDTRYAPLADDMTPEIFGRLTKGMKLNDCEDIFTEAAINQVQVTSSLINKIKADAIIKNSKRTLTLLHSEYGLDSIIGLDNAKKELKKQALSLKAGSPQTARGILLMGSSGTGKSTIARCLGFEAGIPVVSFEKIKDSLVGASEDNMHAAIRNIKAIGNCIVFVDEIDCYVPNRENHQNNDSGVSANLLKILFEFMADESNKGKVLFVGATNYPQSLDFAMLSRFSLKIPIPGPNVYEIPFHMQKSQIEIVGESTIDVIHPDIVEASRIIWEKGGSDGRIIKDLVSITDFSPESILEAAKRFTGKSKVHDDIKAELTAYEMTQDKGFFPWYGNREYNLSWYLKDLVNLETGDYDLVKSLERRRTL
jgi:hypothetical protein